MKVHVVLEDWGPYDGGSTISGIFTSDEAAKAWIASLPLPESSDRYCIYSVVGREVTQPKPADLEKERITSWLRGSEAARLDSQKGHLALADAIAAGEHRK